MGTTQEEMRGTMHPVADKVAMKSFEGQVDILGKTRDVVYCAEYRRGTESGEPSSFAISGVTIEEAWEILSRLHGPVAVKSEPAAKPAAEQAKKEEPSPDAAKPAGPKKDAPKLEAAKAPAKPELVDVVDDDLADEEHGG